MSLANANYSRATRTTARLQHALADPFCRLSPRELLDHFQHRNNVNYFPVVDDEEASRAKTDHVVAGQFDFVGECHTFTGEPSWCSNPSSDIEWQILLHKFYYGVGLGIAFQQTAQSNYAECWRELTASWIQNVPLEFLTSDVMGRRVQNWIYAHWYFVNDKQQHACPLTIDATFYAEFLLSLHDQTEYLTHHLTPARNHRTIELSAIFWTALVFPEFRKAASWLAFATDELARNIQEDFHDDGVHIEQSTDYHHLVLKNYLNIKRLAHENGYALPYVIDRGIHRAAEFSMFAHKPDGVVPSFSDGDARCFLSLLSLADEIYDNKHWRYIATSGRSGVAPSERSKTFPNGGYTILRGGWGQECQFADERYLMLDCGPLGAGNHGHLDLLSIEVAAGGRSLIVDPGRFTYDESGETNWRARFRGTAAHNTVVVDGRNQTRYEPRSPKWKVRGPAPAHCLQAFVTQERADFVHGWCASHEYDVIHERRIFFCVPDYWIISDTLTSPSRHDYATTFQLSHTAQERVDIHRNGGSLTIASPNLLLVQPDDSQLSVEIDQGFVSTAYGTKCAAPVVRFKRTTCSMTGHTIVMPHTELDAPTVSVRPLDVFRESDGRRVTDVFALRIEIQRSGTTFIDEYCCRTAAGAESYVFGDQRFSDAIVFARRDTAGKVLRHHVIASAQHDSSAATEGTRQ